MSSPLSQPRNAGPAGLALVLCVLLPWLAACGTSEVAPPADSTSAAAKPPADSTSAEAKSSGGKHAVIQMDKGAIEIEFIEDAAPRAVENFRLLAERGYYNGVMFHRVIKGFMIQGGDPKGDGTGGESAWGGDFDDEIERGSALYRDGYRRGILAMANAGPNTNGSQFFIMHADYPLQPNYVIFGRVTAGMDVVDAIANTPTTTGGDGAPSKPITPQVMKTVTIKP